MSADLTARVGDHDRQRVADALGVNVADGRLSLSEYDDRLAAAYGATTFADLQPLLADLPSVTRQPEPQPASSSAGGCASGRELREQWAVWGLVNAICVGIWLAVLVSTGHMSGFWPIWVIGPWGFVLLSKTTGSRGRALQLRS